MATTKSRITVTLTQRQHEVLKSIAESGGATMSGMLGEFIESAMPTFERMAATFQQVRKANIIERSRIVEALSDAQTALEPIALAAAGQFDLFLGKLEDAAGIGVAEARSDTGAAVPAALPTPSTNRGVTTSADKQPQAKRSKALKPVSKPKVSIQKTPEKQSPKEHKTKGGRP